MRMHAAKLFVLGLGLCMVGLPVAVRADKPIAPPARMRSDLTAAMGLTPEQAEAMSAYLEQTRRDWEKGVTIPPAGEVGVPVPAGALFIGSGTMGATRNVSLITPDTPDQVRRFYDERLDAMPGWRWSDEFDVFYLYEGALTLQNILSFTIPLIEIETVEPDHFFFMSIDPDQVSQMKSVIQISYPDPEGNGDDEAERE